MTKANRLKAIQSLHSKAEKALQSAVSKAILQHELAGVPAVIWQNGRVVNLPSQLDRAARRKK